MSSTTASPKLSSDSWRIIASVEKKRLNALGTARLMTAISIIEL